MLTEIIVIAVFVALVLGRITWEIIAKRERLNETEAETIEWFQAIK